MYEFMTQTQTTIELFSRAICDLSPSGDILKSGVHESNGSCRNNVEEALCCLIHSGLDEGNTLDAQISRFHSNI
ncbi:hypothetical protein FRX31_035262 [Thalictrum thalictroides]|uniref:Uncharacterized protein n=1 Tax=Thalictrum thalictroides TaxID=46969 RepID=A0A7J6USA9_THATH|nr:hypothetical protein FRX31_035262 [Thalictrum thalictroides]